MSTEDRTRTSAWRSLTGVALVLLITLGIAVLLATRLPESRFLRTVAEGGLDYSPDSIQPLAPLDPEFVASVLSGALKSDPQDTFDQTLTLAPTPPPSPLPLPSPSPTAVPTASPTPPFALRSDLTISLAANRSKAPPGGVIGYGMIVKNVGNARFAGDIILMSHVPKGTHPCTNMCGGVTRMPVDQCILQSQFATRQGGEHEYVFTVPVTLEPGQLYQHPPFYVCVGDVGDGYKIVNHAHVASVQEEEISAPVVVVVDSGADTASASVR